MLSVPTALLFHTSPAGDHHDWLLGEPARGPAQAGSAPARLWAARVAPSSREWAALRCFELTPLPPHRPRYLRYEGELTGGRGRVRRMDAGYAVVMRWGHDADEGDAGVLAVRMAHFAGWLKLVPPATGAGRWEARVLAVDHLAEPGPALRCPALRAFR